MSLSNLVSKLARIHSLSRDALSRKFSTDQEREKYLTQELSKIYLHCQDAAKTNIKILTPEILRLKQIVENQKLLLYKLKEELDVLGSCE